MRYFIAFKYFGKAYHGWQRQPNAITVQEVLENVLSTILGKKIVLVGAGRTDAGVHAKQMFAHFDLSKELPETDLIHRINAFLPEDISVRSLHKVPNTAHARFDAISRTYAYWIVRKKDPFLTEYAHYINQSLDVPAMNKAASYLIGLKDFQCFSKSHTDVKTYNCDLTEAIWEETEDKLVFTIKADRFLRNMVRAIVGTLLDVGRGKLKPEDVKTIIKSKDRGQAGASVPAKGLYLTKIEYPENILSFHG